ncbi:unnamed protein product [Prorocentrum cordatum]|uniref:Uncharacterized protein n=1 Tax=Prorocentrum cordatum TaxID=2364126 RepID=A0ABN9VTT4_9DINO|nr:unnamed protein product [Polarella glacialis]
MPPHFCFYIAEVSLPETGHLVRGFLEKAGLWQDKVQVDVVACKEYGLTLDSGARRQDGLWIANPFLEAEREVTQESAQQDAKWKTEKDLMRKAVSDLKVSQTEKGHVREGASDVKGKTKQVVKEKTEKDRKAVSDQKVSKDRKRKAVSPSPSSESSNAWDILRWKRKNRCSGKLDKSEKFYIGTPAISDSEVEAGVASGASFRQVKTKKKKKNKKDPKEVTAPGGPAGSSSAASPPGATSPPTTLDEIKCMAVQLVKQGILDRECFDTVLKGLDQFAQAPCIFWQCWLFVGVGHQFFVPVFFLNVVVSIFGCKVGEFLKVLRV